MAALPQNSSVTNGLARRNRNLCTLPDPCSTVDRHSVCPEQAITAVSEIMIALLSSGLNIPTKQPHTLSAPGT